MPVLHKKNLIAVPVFEGMVPVDNTPKKTSNFMAYIVAARQMICKGTICPGSSSKCLLLYYCSNVNKDGKFFKSTLDICLETGLAESTVYTLNALWEKWTMLTVTRNDWRSGKANDYQIHLKVLQQLSENTQVIRKDKTESAKKKAAIRSQRYRENKAARETLVTR
jgi:hypothetical protein